MNWPAKSGILEQSALLIEVMMKIERPLEKVRDDRWAVTPIDRARIHK